MLLKRCVFARLVVKTVEVTHWRPPQRAMVNKILPDDNIALNRKQNFNDLGWGFRPSALLVATTAAGSRQHRQAAGIGALAITRDKRLSYKSSMPSAIC